MNSVRRVTVRVPATTANIGPGFDCIGFALDIWNETTVERAPFGFQIEGEGEASLPRDSRNLVITGLMSAFRGRRQARRVRLPLQEFGPCSQWTREQLRSHRGRDPGGRLVPRQAVRDEGAA